MAECAASIKSIELQLVRVETILHGGALFALGVLAAWFIFCS